MITRSSWPTPHADVNAIVAELLAAVCAILGDRFVGLYLHGSLALDDFTPGRSDIDFLVVTEDVLGDEPVAGLHAMHGRLAAGPSPWGVELEGSYIPHAALRRYDPAQAVHPHIERGRQLVVEQHASDGVILRYVVRERGPAVAGPPPATLIDPISAADLRAALAELLREWWMPMLDDPHRLRQRGYQAYAVLTMCRVLHTFTTGEIVPKPVAAHWAQVQYGERWAVLIDRAHHWRHDAHAIDRSPVPDAEVDATRELIRFTCERGAATM
jgi:hypothetical protein